MHKLSESNDAAPLCLQPDGDMAQQQILTSLMGASDPCLGSNDSRPLPLVLGNAPRCPPGILDLDSRSYPPQMHKLSESNHAASLGLHPDGDTAQQQILTSLLDASDHTLDLDSRSYQPQMHKLLQSNDTSSLGLHPDGDMPQQQILTSLLDTPDPCLGSNDSRPLTLVLGNAPRCPPGTLDLDGRGYAP